MPQNVAELNKLIARARAEAARGSKAVDKDQSRQRKFKGKHRKAKKMVKRFAKKPKKRAVWQARQARAAQKIRYWTGREADDIERKRSAKNRVGRLRKKRAALQPKGGQLASKGESYIGTNEGGTLQRRWASNLGYSSYLPWCSIFVANMLLEARICINKDQLPPNPAYSGAWFNWSRGRRVNRSEAQRGDILVFDWGDGGMTDHVAIYQGGGKHVGGNQSDQVNSRPTPWGNVVGVVRPL